MPPGAPRVARRRPPQTQEPNYAVRATKKNPLNSYRSYNYVFTLAALRSRALEDPDSYKNGNDYFVIAKSGGKGTTGITVPSSLNDTVAAGAKPMEQIGGWGAAAAIAEDAVRKAAATDASNKIALIQGFNAQSPGRFDFYIDNVRIDTVVGGNETASMAIATKIEFDVFEPYSMTGFIEALQVSATAAGHVNYMQCPYLLKMEFKGYKDSDELVAETVPESTRYFVMGFTGLDITVDETGSKYACKCVPYNEKAFGEVSKLKADLMAKGTTVREILTDLIKGLNASLEEDAKLENTNEDKDKFDTYEIVFPKITETGVDESYLTNKDSYTPNDIATANVVELLKSNTVYQFDDPGDEKSETIRLDPKNPVMHFAKDVSIHDCIVSVIRDSEFTRNILRNFRIDQDGMVNYFMVHVESVKKGLYDNKKNKECYIYRYVVIEYKIHYTRIQPRPVGTVDTSRLKTILSREYNYLYTGKNVDIKKFELHFNTLFFQAIPRAVGNKPTMPAASAGVQSSNPPTAALPQTSSSNSSPMGTPPTQTSAARSAPTQSGLPNSTFPQNDPYTDLAKGMHQAILENVDQCEAKIEIYGDPYYLVSGGSGNQKLKLNPDNTAGDGEAPIYTSDVHILILFRNPVDIDPNTGFAYFDNRVALYSGIFRLLQVEHRFKEGEFSQVLQLIRIPAQIEDTNQAPAETPAPVESQPNPAKEAIPEPPPIVSLIQPSDDNLLAEIAKGLPVLGLPGELSNLIPGTEGGLADAVPGRNAIGSLVNNIVSEASGAINAAGNLVNQLSGIVPQGLTNLGSAIRLADSGLSALSSSINSAGGSVDQLAETANSIGLTKVTTDNLAKGVSDLASGLATDLTDNALSKVGSLNDAAAGLVSEVGSKVSGLSGKSEALAAQLGITPSSLSGLSTDLQSSLVKTISDAAKSLPSNVDLTSAVDKGLIFNNIPVAALKNIPASQPDVTAPLARLNLTDVKFILDRGGSLDNLPGVSSIPGINDLLKNVPTPSLGEKFGIDANVAADKLSTIQGGINQLTGNVASVEGSLNKVTSLVQSGVPNTSDISSSVVTKFGSSSESPLKNLINSNASG